MTNKVETFRKIQDSCFEIFKTKNNDYGDAFEKYGTLGVLVRINDKLSRYTNISKNSIQISVSDETLKDTLMDLHNYAAMAIMCIEDS